LNKVGIEMILQEGVRGKRIFYIIEGKSFIICTLYMINKCIRTNYADVERLETP